MSEIISVIVCEPSEDLSGGAKKLELEGGIHVKVVSGGRDSPSFAPHFAAIWQRLGWSASADALILLGRTEEGYETSSVFLPLEGEIGAEVAYYQFANEARRDLERILRLAIALSKHLLILAESTYSLPDSSPEEKYDSFAVEEPLTLEAFLRLHDNKELREAVIYQVVN
ncbi:MAG TPA: hypothetical protein VFS30_06480 [Dehalococcoidia bacterium]|nr:hypothetical protein [Dehalococcoidia bacterium]